MGGATARGCGDAASAGGGVLLCEIAIAKRPFRNDAKLDERLKILMAGPSVNAQNDVARVLEYRRKKYLAQAVAVVLVAMGPIVAVAMFVEAELLKLPAVMIILLVAYLMLKELRDELQIRGENLIFALPTLRANGVFDYGQGIAKGSPLFDSWKYDVRECCSVVRGKGFIIEEDRLYAALAAKPFKLKLAVFEGIVLAVNAQNEAQAKRMAQSAELRCVAEKLQRFFSVKNMRIVADGMQIGLFFKTEKRLFHQFSLLKTNSVGVFLQRLQVLRTLAAEAAEIADRPNPVDKD